MKAVCIVGAGPAGLVAAKTFLQTGRFAVTIYEKNKRIGGIWALDENTQDGFIGPQTPTNLSRFTVGFSDLGWNEVDLYNKRASHETANGDSKAGPVPTFPKAWQANRYLEEYRKRYIPQDLLMLGMEVAGSSRVEQEDRAPFWRVEVKDLQGQRNVKEFDYLVVASGFFASPRLLGWEVPGLANHDDSPAVRALHSSQFRSLNDLFPDGKSAAGKTILLFGGGNSAGETAAGIAMQLSDAMWSPDKSRQKLYRGCKIVHITPRPLYALPPYHEYEKGSLTYVPIDFKLYNFSKRPQMDSYAGQQSMEVRDIVHNALQTMVGGDQSDLGSDALNSPPRGEHRGTVYVTLTETYSEFVRSGIVDVKAGRVMKFDRGSDGTVTAIVHNIEERCTIENVGAVIYATGYTPSTALGFISDHVKSELQYDPDSARLPLILDQWQTINRKVPDAAFLGFYEGPYWPMMEMQARLTANRWVNDNGFASPRPYEDTEKLLQLRKAMQEKALDVPQYWFGDYLGYLEDIASHLQLKRNDGCFGEREGCPSPARYLSVGTNEAEAKVIMGDLHQVWNDCVKNGKFVARAVLRALHGHWDISRTIQSPNPAFSGTLEGEASFHPRFPTKDKSGKAFDLERLYIESGTFTSASGVTMLARRRYVYRYSEAEDRLSVWFVKPDNDLEVDYLFHDLSFVSPSEARKAGACVAKADHLCVDDMYWTQYTLPMEAIALRRFEIKHTVKGPQKDYVATTHYSRPPKATDKR